MIQSTLTIYKEDIIYLTMIKELYKKSEERQSITDQYYYSSELSTSEGGIWINHNTKNCIIGFRGDTTSYTDMKTTISLKCKIMIKDTRRFHDNLKQVTEIKTQYNNYSFAFIGFSWGGLISMEMLWLYPKDNCIVFNVGYGSSSRYNGLNIRYYSGIGDPSNLDILRGLKECIIIHNSSHHPNKKIKKNENLNEYLDETFQLTKIKQIL